jgi:hypothetical protein
MNREAEDRLLRSPQPVSDIVPALGTGAADPPPQR